MNVCVVGACGCRFLVSMPHSTMGGLCSLSLGLFGDGVRGSSREEHASRTLETVDQSFVISRLHGCVHDSVAACVSDK